jgi:transposase
MTDVTHFSRVVGMDISKSFCDVFVRSDGRAWRQERSKQGIKTLVANMKTAAPDLILMEATGGYEKAWADALAEAGLPVRVVNARQARHFAIASGQLAKTDQLDAKVLALMAERLPPAKDYVVDHERKKLAALVKRRSQLIDMRTAESNRLDECLCDKTVGKLISSLRTQINKQIAGVDALIDDAIKNHPQWRALFKAYMAVKGVGRETARMMITNMPELGTLNRRQAAALAGLAPMANQSGSKSKQQHIRGGRKEPRGLLYMASISASRWNPVLKETYKNLLKDGRAKRKALIAIARKLLLHLNSIARKIIAQNYLPDLD